MLIAGHALAEPFSPPSRSIETARDCAGGGVVLPGTRTCLRLGGMVGSSVDVRSGRSDFRLDRGGARLRSSARVDLDARTPTELGPLRVFSSIRLRSGGEAPR